MSIEILEKYANETKNEELLNAVNAVKTSNKSNVDRLSFLEREMKTATEKRDSIKSLVRNKLGIEEFSEEALEEAIKKMKDGKTSDGEIKNLTSMVEMLKVEKESIERKYVDSINSYKIEKQLTTLGAIEETEGNKAYDIVLNEVRIGAEFDQDGNIVFKAKDGTTIRNSDGSPMTLADRYNQIKDSDDFAFLFKKKRAKAGGGAGGGAGGQQVTSLEGLNEAQRVALFKQNPERYRQLAGL